MFVDSLLFWNNLGRAIIPFPNYLEYTSLQWESRLVSSYPITFTPRSDCAILYTSNSYMSASVSLSNVKVHGTKYGFVVRVAKKRPLVSKKEHGNMA